MEQRQDERMEGEASARARLRGPVGRFVNGGYGSAVSNGTDVVCSLQAAWVDAAIKSIEGKNRVGILRVPGYYPLTKAD